MIHPLLDQSTSSSCNISSSGDVDGLSIILKVQEMPSFGLQNSSGYLKLFLKTGNTGQGGKSPAEEKKKNMSVYLFITFVTFKG